MTNYEAIQKFDSENLAKFLFEFEVNTACKVLSSGFVDTLDLVQFKKYMDEEFDGFERLKFHEPPEEGESE